MSSTIWKCSVFVFHRDLRLQDNLGLEAALSQSQQVLPIFIFDPRQIKEHDYRSLNALQFMLESLEELEQELKAKGARFFYFQGLGEDVLEQLFRVLPIEAVYTNADYTPFAIRRDQAMANICRENKIEFISCHDALLLAPNAIRTSAGSPYTKFTPFYKKAVQLPVSRPLVNKASNYWTGKVTTALATIPPAILERRNGHLAQRGGRSRALEQLRQLSKLVDYEQIRNLPEKQGTSMMSAHNKFGTCSIREFYWAIVDALGVEHELVREIFWRDFFSHIAYHSPKVFGRAFRSEFDAVTWDNNPDLFMAWCEGATGFPIVDAGMRELNVTGYMHNRVRMIVASFLTKDLHIDWRWGERYFAQKLVDYDPAVNNGNWQWVASTGCDAQPYFRIFNPWLQQKKFDSECAYIKRWVPELANVPARNLHRLGDQEEMCCPGYPKPVVDHREEREVAEELYRSSLEGQSK